MKKLSMERAAKMTFAKGCKSYLDNCKQRNLREGTINHYRQSFDQFFRYFDADMPLEEFNAEKYRRYVVHLCETLHDGIFPYAEAFLDLQAVGISFTVGVMPVAAAWSIRGCSRA